MKCVTVSGDNYGPPQSWMLRDDYELEAFLDQLFEWASRGVRCPACGMPGFVIDDVIAICPGCEAVLLARDGFVIEEWQPVTVPPQLESIVRQCGLLYLTSDQASRLKGER